MRDADSIPERIPMTTVTRTARRVGGKVTVSAMERTVPTFMERLRFDITHYLDEFCQAEQVHLLEDPEVKVVASWIPELVRGRAPRRWWHKLLFLHPMEDRVVRVCHVGDRPGATDYEFGWSAFVIDVPDSMVGSVRATWQRRRDVHFTFEPPKGYQV